jgi:hypothetical protein
MISMDKYSTSGSLIYNIEVIKKEYSQCYNSLSSNELEPYKIILSSNLILKKNESLEKILLFYTRKLIILKKQDDRVSKHIIQYSDINYIVNEGVPDSSCLTIVYASDTKEKIIYDSKASGIVESMLYDLRKFTVAEIRNIESISDATLSDLDESEYIGASIAEKALLDKCAVIFSLKQKRVYDYAWWLFRRTITQAHFTIICNNEIVIFLENSNSKSKKSINGDLVFIPIKALKSTSIEATGKGMILRYQFYSHTKYELFFENERTDELLKVMSFLNGMIASEN